MALLNTERFKTVTTDPIAATKREMQKIFLKNLISLIMNFTQKA